MAYIGLVTPETSVAAIRNTAAAGTLLLTYTGLVTIRDATAGLHWCGETIDHHTTTIGLQP